MIEVKRKAKCYIWVHPDDCNPPHGLDMDSDRDRKKVSDLKIAFESKGFDENYPALVGYPLDGKIQLLSGTHRHMAAKLANIKLPVTLWLRSDIEETWGTDCWDKTIQDIPVNQLKSFEIMEGSNRSPYVAVSLQEELVYDPKERAKEKQKARDEDERAMASGELTPEQIQKKNGLFYFPDAKIDFRSAKKV